MGADLDEHGGDQLGVEEEFPVGPVGGRPGLVPLTVLVASMPWAFTQHQPLGTAEFIREAECRGVALRPPVLRELYRRRLLVPFVYVTNHRVGEIPLPLVSEPSRGGTSLVRLRYARDRGRLSNLAQQPFRRDLRFDQRGPDDPAQWWNRHLYSWYQLLVLPELKGILADLRGQRTSRGGVVARLPEPGMLLLDRADRLRRTAVALTALEARYLPKLDEEWLRLVNAEPEEWQHYRERFSPVAVGALLDYPAAWARQDAEWLLLRARRLDPVGDSWSQLIRRAPATAWANLSDNALLAMDYRIAAEVLLLFYQDLTDQGQAEPLPDTPTLGWNPFAERLSRRSQTLDENLMDLGISPHPRVILAIEGETEQVHVPLVWRELGYPDAPELMRLLMLGGVTRDLEKVAAVAVAPLVGQKAPTERHAWLLIKPPSRLFIAVDPEGRYFAPQHVAKTRADILNEIRAVLRAQGVERPNSAELDELVEIRTWSASCYEFAHFTDAELADGIMSVHRTINGWTRDELVAALEYWRRQGTDIKRVWESGRWDDQRSSVTGRWDYVVSKTELATALWPALKGKIDRCRVDDTAPVPEIVQVVSDTYHLAQQWRYLSFLLSEET